MHQCYCCQYLQSCQMSNAKCQMSCYGISMSNNKCQMFLPNQFHLANNFKDTGYSRKCLPISGIILVLLLPANHCFRQEVTEYSQWQLRGDIRCPQVSISELNYLLAWQGLGVVLSWTERSEQVMVQSIFYNSKFPVCSVLHCLFFVLLLLLILIYKLVQIIPSNWYWYNAANMPIATETLLWLLCSEKWRIFTWYLRARRLCPRTILEFQNCDEGRSVWEREQRTFDWSKYFSCDVLYFHLFQITLWMMVLISRPSERAIPSIGSITWSMAQ